MNPDLDPLPHWKISPPRDSARQRALQESLRTLRSVRAEIAERPRRFPWWIAAPTGLIAVAAFTAFILLRPVSENSLDSATLAEFQSLFGTTLNALIERKGQIEVVTAANPPIERGQPILIKAETSSGPVEMVGFSGSRFELELEGKRIGIEPLVEANGTILLCGEHFLWSHHLKMGSLPSSLKNLQATALIPAT